MPYEEKRYHSGAVIEAHDPEQSGGTATSVEEIGQESEISRSEVAATAPELQKPEALPAFPPQPKANAMFVSQRWHRIYAEALLETRGKALEAKIEEAHRAIQARYVQLAAAPRVTEECRDLRNALQALCKLKTDGTLLPFSTKFVV
jgi:hypothetical protein